MEARRDAPPPFLLEKHIMVPYPEIEAGEGLKSFLELIDHLDEIEDTDPACLVKDAWTAATALFAKVWPGEPGDDPGPVIGAATFGSDEPMVRAKVEDIVKGASEADGVSIDVSGLDWSELLRLLLPIILEILEKIFRKNNEGIGQTPPPAA